MPVYLYKCGAGHKTEQFRFMSEWTDTIECPLCHAPATLRIQAPEVHTETGVGHGVRD